MEIILRPVYNRPEMLKLSLDYELAAREYYDFSFDLMTLFIVEYGADPKVIELVEEYPLKKKVIRRDERFGLSKNILEGMKSAFKYADNFIIYIEDDILVHETYFKYMDLLLNMEEIGKFSVLSPYNSNDNGDVHKVYRGHHYAALAPLITKHFYTNYLGHCISPTYYRNGASRNKFVVLLGKNYNDNELYKYRKAPKEHNEQAGLINRLVDIALIEEDMAVIMPEVNRHQHIGYFGKNRPGGIIPGNTFEERLNNLKIIIRDPNKMYNLSAAKRYNDYKIFSPKLREWDGTLHVR